MSTMPEGVFAIRCPNPKCQKFMLVEERNRDSVVECLVCKTKIQLGDKREESK